MRHQSTVKNLYAHKINTIRAVATAMHFCYANKPYCSYHGVYIEG